MTRAPDTKHLRVQLPRQPMGISRFFASPRLISNLLLWTVSFEDATPVSCAIPLSCPTSLSLLPYSLIAFVEVPDAKTKTLPKIRFNAGIRGGEGDH